MALVYFVSAWLVVEISSVVFEPLQIPEWALTLVILLALLGFPVILILAWVFDITDKGIQRTQPLEEEREGVSTAGSAPDAPPSRQSIAVLPFANIGDEKENEYFCDGLAEDVLIRLSRVKGIRVAARSSAFAFKGKHDDIRVIGEQLSVATVLEGTVRKAGDKVRITARLVNAADGYELWSGTYDRQLDDIFKVQDEISLAVVDAFQCSLVPDAEGEIPTRQTTENIEAYKLYLMGRHQFHKRNEASLQSAVNYFRQAIALDEEFALAYTGLSDAYLLLANHGAGYGNLPLQESVSLATPLVARALELDPELGEAHASRGHLLRLQGDHAGAEAELRRAMELNPDYPMAHVWLGLALGNKGRLKEARAEFQRAYELDPLSPIVNTNLGFDNLRFGHFEDARRQFMWVIDLDPAFPVAYSGMAQLERTLGNLRSALEWRQKAVNVSPNRSYYHCLLGGLRLEMGDIDGAEKAIEHAAVLAPDNPAVIEHKIALLIARAQHEALLRYTLDLLAEKPDDKLSLANVAQAYLLCGDLDQAASYYGQVSSLLIGWLNNSLVWNWSYPHALNYANTQAQLGRAGESEDLLAKCVSLVEALQEEGIANPEIQYVRAAIHALHDKNAEALAALREARSQGWRRAWWASRDPSLAGIAKDGAFTALLDSVSA